MPSAIVPATPWFVPESNLDYLLSEPDFVIPLFGTPYFDIDDTEGNHEFIMINSMCGIFEIGNDLIPIDRCVVNDGFPAGRSRAYSF